MSPMIKTPDPIITYNLIFAALRTGWEEAARLYGNFIKAGGTQAQLRKAGPMAPSVWQALDALYHGTLDPRVLLLHIRAKTALMGMPRVEQANLLDHGVKVLGAGGTVQTKRLDELLPAQMRQVFNGHVVRTIDQQRLVLQAPRVTKTSQTAKTVTLANSAPPEKFKVINGKLRVYTNPTVPFVDFTVAEIVTALSTMLTR